MKPSTKKILVTLLMISLCLSSYSQEKTKKGERGPFKTNEKAFDNTFIGVAGGVNFNFGDFDNGNLSPAIDFYFGKWWTPQVGARIGYSGIQLKGLTDNPYAAFLQEYGQRDEKWNMHYIHADLMWNICNAIQGYRSDRVWNVMPFIGFGALNANGKNYAGLNANSWDVAGAVGLYNAFTVAKRVDITLEGRYTIAKNEYDRDITQDAHYFDSFISATLGIAVKLGKVGFEKHVTPDYSTYENSIAEYKELIKNADAKAAASAAELAALEERLASLKDEERRLLSQKTGACGDILELFFNRNSSELDEKELSILDTFVKKAGKEVTFVVTGTADNKTGSSSYNKKLSDERADYVSKLLSEKYGIKSISATGAGETETHTNPEMNRTATIVLK